ncbi:isopentenyl pyrophosphate isomerase [Gracilibacillus halophilus YIM-C55.5]|uniref:Isopentenyl-diphosphate delta-isomerase n=1 Tax=Gracilibacillus halophilus YIM-C55.5 TaxID=1308866 RepID=N4WB14_9BACI|nr:type 2 isopentenyl-diphosphate Delta-isomerase [Gracilibacillus halophilus]ENH96449.1 isopentenyl pyrophosphate isomerase [Gracilibacillus halophilus YIM-C55.5]
MSDSIHRRKAEHIEWCLTDEVEGDQVTNGLERYQFRHNALPELDFQQIDLTTTFLQRDIKTPFLISSMTGGAALAETINRHLAQAAEERGWIFALGSTRVMMESEHFRSSFQIRTYAPSIPIIANIGAVQLNYGFTVDQCKQILEWTEADAFVLHLNSIQEVIQPEGDTNFAHLLLKIEQLCQALDVPVGVKEVGFGIDGEIAKKLTDVGVSFIDVAGAGGTSWSQVEKLRSKERIKKQAAEALASWGNPTASCIVEANRSVPNQKVMASGGIRDGLDAAKALALGADHVGFARSVLKQSMHSYDALLEWMEIREWELRMIMFGIGAGTIQQLQTTDRLLG